MAFKDKLKAYVGYDENVAQAASSTKTVAGLTHNVPGKVRSYFKSLFPFVKWLPHYNLTWATGDLIAGFTVGLVVVPQSMSYAKIATLSPEYGLYSSFVGVMIYAIFATSKDVTIGPVAVMSLEVSKVIAHVREQEGGDIYTAPEIATALAFICGFIVLGIGLLRLGWIVEFIPATAVSGFMTGSAISIAAGQVPSLMGYSSLFNTRAETFRVIINSLKHLPDTKTDAAFGLTGLAFLYAVRAVCGHFEKKGRTHAIRRTAFFLSTLRTAFTVVFLTVFAWVYLRHKKPSAYPISVLKTVPSGFQHMGQPKITRDLISRLGPLIPVSTIILLLEHIAISKSFGRVNNYKINPNQELIAIGVTNTIGTLFAAYPATGSFSRTAIKAKAGVRTPIAGWITGIMVIIALYALTSAFYWIPNAGLSAVIIHAVGDLIASPKQVYGFWKVNPLEAIIWAAAVLTTIFSSIENGIYVAVAASLVLLLFRVARPRGHFLGRVRVHPEPDPTGTTVSLPGAPEFRDIYVPLRPNGVTNPRTRVEPAPPGVIVYRFDEAFVYPNASYYVDRILDYAHKTTRTGRDIGAIKKGDRPWNDPGPLVLPWGKKSDTSTIDADLAAAQEAEKPLLRAIVFDFSGVSNIDTTSVQNLVDLRRSLERWADGAVEFHFATIVSPWITRALLAGGFGTGKIITSRPLEIAAVVPSGTEEIPVNADHFVRRFRSPPTSPPNGPVDRVLEKADEEAANATEERRSVGSSNDLFKGVSDDELEAPVVSVKFPRFHIDLPSAVAAASGEDWYERSASKSRRREL